MQRMIPFQSYILGLALMLAGSTAGADNFAAWSTRQPINFDTTPSGANIQGDVKNYPVAVTLTKENFDFSKTLPDGADVRFSDDKSSDTLVHAVEHWDAAEGKALLWVKVPTVWANSKNQTILLHSGNASAEKTSDTHKVFNTREGFVGVWHLNDEPSTKEDGYLDATATRAHGTGQNMTPDSRVDTPLGKGANLNYKDVQWIKVDGGPRRLRNFDLVTKVTFSIWAYARNFSNRNPPERSLPGYETLFAKGDNSWRLQMFGIPEWHKSKTHLMEICVEVPPSADYCVVSNGEMQPGKWYHFTGVHDYPEAKFYINGVLDKAENWPTNWKSDIHPVGIGNQSQIPDRGRQWDGMLDEARILSVAKDDNWIKLDYESQREEQKFLTVGKPLPRS